MPTTNALCCGLTTCEQLQDIILMPAQTFVSQRPPGTLCPGGGRDKSGLSAACAG